MRHWFHWFRRSSRKSRRPGKPLWRLRSYRPNLDVLEDRCLLAAPVIDPIQVPLNVPVGKTLIVPVTASDPDGGTVSISVAPASGTTGVTVTPINDTTFLQISVSHTASSAAGDKSFSGTMEFELFGDVTPRTVSYIEGLVESGFYNGLIFHRVVPNFVIQGGDPTGTGSGGPPSASATQSQIQQLQFPDEFNPNDIFSGTGQLAMANSGNDTNGSQFFVTDGPQRFLDFNHTIFGQLVRGFDILNDVESVPTDSNSRPLSPVTMTNVELLQDPNAHVFLIKSSAGSTPGPVSLTVTATSSTTPTTPTTETVTAQLIADTTNDPPILTVSQAPLNFGQASGNPVTNLVTAKDTPINVTLSSTDLEGDTPIYKVTVTDATANATVTQSSTTPGQFTITPNTGFTGLIHLQASVTENGASRNNGPDSQVFTLAVGDQAVAATAANFSATEGASGTQTLATFTDADLAALPSDFQVSINWGDGTTLDTTSGTVSGSNGHFTAKGTHTYAQAGQYAALVTITDVHAGAGGADNGGAAAQATDTATVSDAALTIQAAPTLKATTGTVLSGVEVATFTDANPGTSASSYTATIDWGDGTSTSAGIVRAASGGGFQVLGSHTYASAGTFSPKVTVNDVNSAGPLNPNPQSANVTDSATITAAPAVTLTAQPTAVSGTAGTALTAVPLATFTDTAANAQMSNYTVMINWDDGTASDTTTGTVQSLGGGKFQVVGTHTYVSSGTFTPAVTITSTNAASNPSTLTLDTTATIGTGTLPATPPSVASNQAYVNQLFLDLIGQAPTPQQLSDFSSQLNNNTRSRSQVAHEILALPAYKTEQVKLVYQNMFGKAPTTQQLTSGVHVIDSTGKVSALRVQLLSSQAFFTTVGGGTDTGYLNALAQEILHGSLDATTQAKLSQELSSGASHLTVLQDLVSAELQKVEQVGVQNVYQQYLHRAPTSTELSAGTSLIDKGKEVQLIQSLVSSTEYFNRTQQTGTTVVTSSAGTSLFGQPVTFTATVGSSTSGSAVPTGTVMFEDVTSGATLGTATLNATGKATFTTSSLSVGTHTIRAVYSGDKTFPASTGTVTQTVNQAGSTTALNTSANPATSTTSIALTAKVTATAPSAGTPTGTVTFTDTSTNTTLGTVPVDTTGTAVLTTTGLGVGTHNITASYAGTANYSSSSGQVSQVVNP